ncbi:PEPxxWA-CTERM sorting domain-containing protein [Sphingomonas sp. XMGL2]|uniref:PEPxxWA-CTERM sorting domain-containing protein n=2 Tax=Sphingomonas quercus TaxID=2842451 RepID=A0ABS6BKE1_9SPHN|nr:PEPxxWA-CTERM sorting domain-containing protein [Sphingomonas quercus]
MPAYGDINKTLTDSYFLDLEMVKVVERTRLLQGVVMFSLVNRGLIAAVALAAASQAPAAVLVISFTGTVDKKYVQDLATGATVDGGAQSLAGTIRIDTALLGANGAADPDFSWFRDDAQFLAVSLSFSGGIAPMLGGDVYRTDALAGSFGGYGSIDKTWVAGQSVDAGGNVINISSSFSFGGDFVGDILVGGIRLPEFASAIGLDFYVTDSMSVIDAAGAASGTARTSLGMIDSLSVAIEPDAVPEPAAWAMMITGFGLTGAALRRRTAAALAA